MAKLFVPGMGMRPNGACQPTTPHWLAGWRIDPVLSPPVATVVAPAAREAAEPPEDPPGEMPRRQGLWVTPPDARMSGVEPSELGHRGAREEIGAGIHEPLDIGIGHLVDVILEDHRALRGPPAGDARRILDRQGDAGERPGVSPLRHERGLRLPRAIPCLVEVAVAEGIDAFGDPFCPVDQGIEQLHRRQRPLPETPRRLVCRHVVELVIGHRHLLILERMHQRPGAREAA